MTKKRMFLKNLCVLGIAIIVWCALAFFRRAGLVDFLNGLTIIIFAVAVTLIIEGIVARLFGYKKGYRISWKYLLFEGLLFIDCLIWAWLSACSNWRELVLRSLVLLIGLAGAGVWGFLFALKEDEAGEAEEGIENKEEG